MALISWRRDVEPILADLEAVRFWDLAATKPLKPGHDPDYTAGVLLAVTRGKLGGVAKGRWIVVDVTRFRETPGTTDRLMFERHETDDEMMRRAVPIRVEHEGGASGVRDVDGMRRGVFLGLDFDGKRPDGPKAERAKPFSRAAQAGNVDLVEAPWNLDFLDEFELFNDGLHDDQVDATSGAMQFLRQRVGLHGAAAETVMREQEQEAPTWGTIS